MIQTENRIVIIRERIENIYKYLHRHKEYLNRLNVFPVPDGDTGINMFLTMKSAVEAVDKSEDTSAAAICALAARGALLGARGNSGVILSQ
ncbi:MAG TPA: DAK2 domain fusion protein YloV, partial [Bacteroidales bacterium]|nr:DAK2 domain fusion protein YloV [Bacteroidales bacterium]